MKIAVTQIREHMSGALYSAVAITGQRQGEDTMQAVATHLATVPETASPPVHITTTLYDLVEAVNTAVALDEDRLVAAAVMHLINTSRARFVGSRKTLTVVAA
jgi:hypothetical protein